MYTLTGQNFINMIRSFYPGVRIASGGREVVVRCFACGDSKDLKHAHLYISVPQSNEEVSLYQCKKCSNKGVVDDSFLRKLGCDDPTVLIEINKHNKEIQSMPKYATMKSIDIYPLKNTYISNHDYNITKLQYINSRIGSNFTFNDLLNLKIVLNLYDVINQNRLELTRDPKICNALDCNFIGFISYDNAYCTMRRICPEGQLYKTIDKRYINYNLLNKFDNSKDFYVIPTSINLEDSSPVKIHIAEGAFDVLSIYYNLNNCNNYQNIYISASGKSYLQALEFILSETGIINYEVHMYPDNDVTDREFDIRVVPKAALLPCDLYIHRNMYHHNNIYEKDYGVPKDRIDDKVRIIYEKRI